jgi:alkylation response protein AidB-like acyl-CoA dehydrogenase
MTGGAFLLESAHDSWTPEDLGEDHRAIGRSIDEFWTSGIAPGLEALLAHEPGTGRMLLRRAAALGLCAMQIPERFGGLDLDLSSVIVAIEHLANDPSYLGWHLGHSGIGTLPLVYYGTPEQQARYLPRLATVDLLAAYALTEPQSGSDVRGLRTRADLAPDGRTYRLSGQKAWITNGGDADLFTVFAKVGGEQLTAFLVERGFGVVSGAEERKMGLSGTSTTALYFDGTPVPASNVLGEIGQGHRIAFNILNVGRLEMGPLALRGSANVLQASIAYARTRRAFGSPIAAFGAIQHKVAECALRMFVLESTFWRVVGCIEAYARARSGPDAERAAFEEFGAECSIVKVFASETLDFVADEGVQIHGGAGVHRDSYVERAYRDARVNRIFEGTNEINRLLIPMLLLKRARAGRLPILRGPDVASDPLPRTEAARASDEMPAAITDHQIAESRTLTRALLSAADRAYGDDLPAQQEIVMQLADLMIDIFAMESALLRARRLAVRRDGPIAAAMAAVFMDDARTRIARAAGTIIAALGSMADSASLLPRVRALASGPAVDTIRLRRQIAAHLLA